MLLDLCDSGADFTNRLKSLLGSNLIQSDSWLSLSLFVKWALGAVLSDRLKSVLGLNLSLGDSWLSLKSVREISPIGESAGIVILRF